MNLYKPYQKDFDTFLMYKMQVERKPASKKDYHELRRCLKRIKAFLNLSEFISNEKLESKSIYKEFKPIFKNAGKIREGQINLQLLKHYGGTKKRYAQYYTYIKQIERKAKINFDMALLSFNDSVCIQNNKLIKGVVNILSKQEFIAHCYKFLTRKFKLIKELNNVSGADHLVHQIRIQLKAAGAIAMILSRLDSELIEPKFLKQIKKTETLIGDWHDLFVLNNSIIHFLDQVKLSDRQQMKYFKTLNKVEKQGHKKLNQLKTPLSQLLKTANHFF